MIEVHFLASSGLFKSVRASVIAVADLVGGHALKPLGLQTASLTGAVGDAASGVWIAIPPGLELPGARTAGLYEVEGLDPAEAERELFAAPGETGG